MDYAREYKQAREQLAQWLREGKIRREETIYKGGLQKVEEAFNQLFEGKNKGALLA
jgi:NADPH-dependent curcumin reductase CurA